MSTRIDDLEKNIADLMTQAGVEEVEATTEKPKEGQGSSWRQDLLDPSWLHYYLFFAWFTKHHLH